MIYAMMLTHVLRSLDPVLLTLAARHELKLAFPHLSAAWHPCRFESTA